jgi:DNA-binding winged helix-turn-helix (wHTH) protein
MKIVIYTPEPEVINIFNRYSKGSSSNVGKGSITLQKADTEVISVRTERALFDLIADDAVEGFAIHIPSPFAKKAIDFIKRKSPYIPVILFGKLEGLLEVTGADIYMPFTPGTDMSTSYQTLFDVIISNISSYSKSFDKLKKLTTKMAEVIEFGNCKYDPTRRTLFFKEKEVKKLSAKEGGIMEILSTNYGEVVKREIILEKVWHKDDYFAGRSMDVYVTNLRKLFGAKKVNLSIKNISGVGLILEHESVNK